MKQYNIIIKEEAKNEIFEAFDWYESKQIGLGKRFVNIIDKKFYEIKLSPKKYPIVFENMRKTVIKNFPFIIVFEIENSDIIVYAVFHTKQNPDNLKRK